MSTRGVFGFRIDGADKLSINHCDSAPDALGDAVLYDLNIMLKRYASIDNLRKRVRRIELVGRKTKPTLQQQMLYGRFSDISVGNQTAEDWYCLLRRLQGELYKTLVVGVMLNWNDFIYNSVMCEWGYIVNMDTKELEVYEGFQEKPAKGRYGFIRNPESKWYGCGLVLTVPFKRVGSMNKKGLGPVMDKLTKD